MKHVAEAFERLRELANELKDGAQKRPEAEDAALTANNNDANLDEWIRGENDFFEEERRRAQSA